MECFARKVECLYGEIGNIPEISDSEIIPEWNDGIGNVLSDFISNGAVC